MLAKAETSSGERCRLPGSHQAQLSSSYFCVAKEVKKRRSKPLECIVGDKEREMRVIPCTMVNLKCFWMGMCACAWMDSTVICYSAWQFSQNSTGYSFHPFPLIQQIIFLFSSLSHFARSLVKIPMSVSYYYLSCINCSGSWAWLIFSYEFKVNYFLLLIYMNKNSWKKW